jgi:hypothetical protein
MNVDEVVVDDVFDEGTIAFRAAESGLLRDVQRFTYEKKSGPR